MANEFKHYVPGTNIPTKDEYTGAGHHVADGQQKGDFVWFDGSYWRRLSLSALAGLIGKLELLYTSPALGNLRNGWAENGIYFLCREQNNLLEAYDVYNPETADPVLLGSIAITTPIDLRKHRGSKYIYVSTGGHNSIFVVDTQNLSSMISPYELVDATNLNNAHGLCLYKNALYVAAHNGDRLTTVDITVPTRPRISLPSLTGLDGIHDMAADWERELLLVTSHYGGPGGAGTSTEGRLYVYDISDPLKPSGPIGFVNCYSAACIVKPPWSGIYAFMGTSGGLQAFNVANPTSPALVSTPYTGAGGYWIYPLGRRYLLTTDDEGDMCVVDVSNPASMSTIQLVSPGGRNVFGDGNHVYSIGGTPDDKFRIYKITGALELPTLMAGSFNFPDNAPPRNPDGIKCGTFTFVQDNVAANQSAVALAIPGDATRTGHPMIRSGAVTGISVYSNEARTAGTLTVDVTIDGSVTGLQAILNGTNTQSHQATQMRTAGGDAYPAGTLIGVKITTSADWAPTTADIIVEVEVEY